MAADHYFEFLGNVWSQFPTEDRDRLAELWHGYEQVFAAVYQKFAEVKLNSAVQDLQPYTTERWLSYTFSDDNSVDRPASITGTQDLSVGVALASRYLLKFKIDGGPAIEVDCRGLNTFTTIAEIVSKINAAAGFTFARAIFDNTIVQLSSPTSGPSSSIEILPTSIPAANACEFILGVDPESVPKTFPEFRFPYLTPYQNIASIPELRDKIRDESVATTLVEGVDYIVESKSIISFKEVPPAKLWAKRTQVDIETPWNNFGFLMDIYQKNSPRYVDIIQGLWFAFWSGPKPINVKKSLYLLFGLPTAREQAVVTAVSDTEVETTASLTGEVRTFEVPSGLLPAVTVGQEVTRFEPLVTGIDVFDKTNYPGFIEEEVGRPGIARFLTDSATLGTGDTDETKALTLLEEHVFVPQFTVDAFISPDINLGNVKIFLDAIKPLNKTYLFQVIIGRFEDELDLKEHTGLDFNFRVDSTLDSNETTYQEESTLDDYESSDNEGLNLDPHGILFGERVEIEVRSFGSLIDSFSI